MNHYTMLYRPVSRWTLPKGVTWEYVESPWDLPNLINRGIPRGNHRYGVFSTDRPLTADEMQSFEIRAV